MHLSIIRSVVFESTNFLVPRNGVGWLIVDAQTHIHKRCMYECYSVIMIYKAKHFITRNMHQLKHMVKYCRDWINNKVSCTYYVTIRLAPCWIASSSTLESNHQHQHQHIYVYVNMYKHNKIVYEWHYWNTNINNIHNTKNTNKANSCHNCRNNNYYFRLKIRDDTRQYFTVSVRSLVRNTEHFEAPSTSVSMRSPTLSPFVHEYFMQTTGYD